jgi:hypothetical protein
MTTVRCGLPLTDASRNGAVGTNGSSSAVTIRAGTRMRSITRIALAR